MAEYTLEEVAKHNTPQDCWVVVDNKVLNVTKFAPMHPGGMKILQDYAGQDVTEVFFSLHRLDVLRKYIPRLSVGTVKGLESKVDKQLEPSYIRRVPYAETSFWQGFASPYYNETHKTFRKNVRAFVRNELFDEAESFGRRGKMPSKETYRKMGKAGLLGIRIGPGKHLKENFSEIFGVPVDKLDYFHEYIAHSEAMKVPDCGYSDGLGSGYLISLPALMNFGSRELWEKYGRKVLMGELRSCLAISEPYAGSDVANIKTTATLSADGKSYIVNGCKKWITNGQFSDIFITAVRTGGPGMTGISLLLIERSKGVETDHMHTSYSDSSGTAYITFEDVVVPRENIIGKVNQGFQCIMYNFNHERWSIIGVVLAGCRDVVCECFKWCFQRKVFGKPLIAQPVIRNKLARMVARVEAVENWFENITYQMNTLPYKKAQKLLAGPIALCKFEVTRVSHYVADEACQIFGGRAITRSGMGKRIEDFNRSVKFGAILGGSEEIMADLGIRQAMKMYPKDSKL